MSGATQMKRPPDREKRQGLTSPARPRHAGLSLRRRWRTRPGKLEKQLKPVREWSVWSKSESGQFRNRCKVGSGGTPVLRQFN